MKKVISLCRRVLSWCGLLAPLHSEQLELPLEFRKRRSP